jgi:hypothetical protein
MDKFGYSLSKGATYRVRGKLGEDSEGNNVWEFNSLLADRVSNQASALEQPSVVIAGIGSVCPLVEIFDKDTNSIVEERLTLRHQIAVSQDAHCVID